MAGKGCSSSAARQPGVLALILLFTMPESARWMAAKERPAEKIVPLLQKFDPAADLGQYT